ncbi:hypothetical protein [Thiomonas sp.]|jgi:hypothetical protein|uniref:hypothetical protein n=1 Tax=Thiomonas sp. TaxID=2047785 RepID=UPI002627E403|nr:hypothetical protein [Thiomonas sp.]
MAAQDGIDGVGRIQPGGPLRPVGGTQDSGSSAQRQRTPVRQPPPEDETLDKDEDRGAPPGPDTTRGRNIDEMA